MSDPPLDPRQDPAPLEYAPQTSRRSRGSAWKLLGMLVIGLFFGGVLMYLTSLTLGFQAGDFKIIMMFALPVVIGFSLMFVRRLQIMGAGVALAPAMALLALYAICGR